MRIPAQCPRCREVEERRQKRLDAAQMLLRFEELTDALANERKAGEELGLSKNGFALYGELKRTLGTDGKNSQQLAAQID
ncbi:hypothetical protein B4Q13_25080 [Lacticaseibacillus rhamnosus]